MPTATGLPKAGDQVYNSHFKQRFRVMGRSSNSYPLTIYIRPMPGTDFPVEMIRARRRMPDGTLPVPLEVPVDDAFRMGLTHWTNLPDQGEIEPGRIVRCNRDDVHAAHLYLRNRVWHKCLGSPQRDKPREGTPDPAESGTTRVRSPIEKRITAFLRDTEETDTAIRLSQAEGLLRQARSALRRARRDSSP